VETTCSRFYSGTGHIKSERSSPIGRFLETRILGTGLFKLQVAGNLLLCQLPTTPKAPRRATPRWRWHGVLVEIKFPLSISRFQWHFPNGTCHKSAILSPIWIFYSTRNNYLPRICRDLHGRTDHPLLSIIIMIWDKFWAKLLTVVIGLCLLRSKSAKRYFENPSDNVTRSLAHAPLDNGHSFAEWSFSLIVIVTTSALLQGHSQLNLYTSQIVPTNSEIHGVEASDCVSTSP